MTFKRTAPSKIFCSLSFLNPNDMSLNEHELNEQSNLLTHPYCNIQNLLYVSDF